MKLGVGKYTLVEASRMTRHFNIPCLTDIETLKLRHPHLEIGRGQILKRNISFFEADLFKSLQSFPIKTTKSKPVSKASKPISRASKPTRKITHHVNKDERSKKPVLRTKEDGKPGTAGSRQALNPPRRVVKARKPREIFRDDPSRLIIPNYVVDGNIVYTLVEMNQMRVQSSPILSNEPEKVCQRFTLEVPILSLGLESAQAHAEDDANLSSWKAEKLESLPRAGSSGSESLLSTLSSFN